MDDRQKADRAALDEALRAIEAATTDDEINEALCRALRIERRMKGEE